ncbi:MAG: DNA polymerase III subunit chi [Chromatiales bacterium]|nr:DNA polymerase III subunit chi [Chromatiales bacterium]
MTRVDFYILGDDARAGRHLTACRLAEKAWGMGHRVHLHAASAEEAVMLDELLWTFRDGSFLPHERVTEAGADCPVTLSECWEPTGECEVLINLAPEVPGFFSRFERVAEIIDRDEAARRLGRERFRFYRDRGYPLATHELDR